MLTAKRRAGVPDWVLSGHFPGWAEPYRHCQQVRNTIKTGAFMLHSEARILLDWMVQRGVPPTHSLSPADARRFYVERRAVTQPDPPEVGQVQDLLLPVGAGAASLAVPARLYRPLGVQGLLPVLVYFHGGGWVIGDLDTHDVLCRQLANGSGCAVVAVHYRLAPEHRFPAAVDDSYAATCCLRDLAPGLGLDASRLAVGGDSAGGNLAAVVSLMARDAGDLSIAFQLLIYPATDMRQLTDSIQSNARGYLLERETMNYFQTHYTGGNDAVHNDWRASPLLAKDHGKLPPALVLTAGFDPLRDEGMAYADKLSAAGVKTTYVCFERQIHGFITMGRLMVEANAAVRLCATELRAALRP
jgi:acetyl esterase